MMFFFLFVQVFSLFQITSSLQVYKVKPGNHGCVQLLSQEDNLLDDCINLADFIHSYNKTDLEIYLASGQYQLYEANINVSYSLSLFAEPHTFVTCDRLDHTGNTTGTQIIFSGNTTNITLTRVTFQQCVYSFKFEYLKNLVIDNCTFREFQSTAVDVFNVFNVQIFDTNFINNTVMYLNDRYKATSAGLSLSYRFQQMPATNPIINITGCKFENNYSYLPNQSLSEQISQVLNNQYYPARGGGLSIIITEEYANLTMMVVNCSFVHNYAESFGGAVYIILDGKQTAHFVKFSNSYFILNNCSNGGGGGVFLGYVRLHRYSVPSVFEFTDSVFEQNIAKTGGGILTLQTRVNGGNDYTIVRRSNFTKNNSTHGSAITFGSLFNVQTSLSSVPSVIEDCMFDDNMSPGGILIAGFTHIDIKGDNYFLYNNGPTMQVIGCLIQLMGNVTFTGNKDTVTGGVALQLSSFAQVKLYKTAHMFFYNNIGTLGSAIRVDLQQFPSLLTSLIGNPLCFLLYEDESEPPIDWNPDLIYFSGNTAQLGSAIYSSYLDLCSYYSHSNNGLGAFNISQFPHWPVFKFGINNNTGHSDSTDKRYYIQTSAFSIDKGSFNQSILKLYPGEHRVLNITGLDQFNNPTYFVARVIDQEESLGATLSSLFDVTPSFVPPDNYTDLYNKKNVSIAVFDPQLLPIYPNSFNDISYTLDLQKEQLEISSNKFNDIKRVLIQIENHNGLISNFLNISLEVHSCLPGYQILLDNEISAKCICVGAIDNSFAVLECNDATNNIILRNDYWGGHDPENTNLYVYTCPVTYCQCKYDQENCISEYDFNDPNVQCHPPRSGPLCGSCSNNTTVSILRLQCKEGCQNNYQLYYAVVILVVADVVVIVLVLIASIKFSIPLPNSLRGVIFYIQTVYIVTEYFPVSFWDSRQYMLYISNILGLYFPYDFCFLSDAPSVLAFAPQFIPPLLVFIVPLFFLCWQRGRLKIWHGVWSLIQLTYAPLCYTCITLLHCPLLVGTSNDTILTRRWFLDANINCFSDTSHILLGCLAVVFLIGLIALIPIVTMLVLLEDHHFVQKKYPYLLNIIKVLKAGYRPYKAWWGGFELFCRLLLIGLAIGLPGRTVAPVYMVAFMFILQIYIQPHKYNIQNIIAGVILFDYVILLVTRFPQTLLDSLNPNYSGIAIPNIYGSNLPEKDFIIAFYWPLFYLPVFIGIGVCVIWIIYKIVLLYKKKKINLEDSRMISYIVSPNDSVVNYIDHDNPSDIITFVNIDDLKT